MRNRNIKQVMVRVGDLVPHPSNHRKHSAKQKRLFLDLINEIGMYDMPHVFVRKDGRYQLFQGHMRREALISKYGEDAQILVNVTDLTKKEAMIAMVAHDGIGAMADIDADAVERAIAEMQDLDTDTAVGEIVMGLANVPDIPDEEDVTTYRCPRCGHCW